MIRIVNKFSDDIGMSFGADKCKKLTIQRGKIVHMENIQLDNGEELRTKIIEIKRTIQILRIWRNLIIDKTTKSALKNEYFKRLKF